MRFDFSVILTVLTIIAIIYSIVTIVIGIRGINPSRRFHEFMKVVIDKFESELNNESDKKEVNLNVLVKTPFGKCKKCTLYKIMLLSDFITSVSINAAILLFVITQNSNISLVMYISHMIFLALSYILNTFLAEDDSLLWLVLAIKYLILVGIRSQMLSFAFMDKWLESFSLWIIFCGWSVIKLIFSSIIGLISGVTSLSVRRKA